MENINKKLACGLWAVSGISALVPMVLSLSGSYYFNPVSLIVTLLIQLLLGYQIFRDKNDFQTMITVIVITILSLNLGGVIAFVLRLIIRKNNSEKVRNYWFIPAVVTGVSSMTLLFALFPIGLLLVCLNVAYYLIFGYWFIKYLKLN